ncbi:MAG: hypothetical protein OXH79_03955 [Boseongicola sp.]|nr:hypothetical protein [Boseongicola sp.]
MMDLAEYAAAVVDIAGGQVVGKTRLQKIVYLLEAKGLGCDLDFDYHNFGPYSADLAFAVHDAEALGYLSTDEKRGYHEVPYTIFTANPESPKFEENDRRPERMDAVKVMENCSAVVLELAATAVYLKDNGYANSAWEEVRRRKGIKASSARLSAAKELVQSLQL